MIRFGPGGNDSWFYSEGNKSSTEMPKWLNSKGLTAYEYQANRGVKLSEEKAKELGEQAKQYNIDISIHSPYYISLSSPNMEKKEKSVQYIIDCMRIAKPMGSTRIVVHSGAILDMTREESLAQAKITLRMAIDKADELGYGDIRICPETMGKINQLGNVDEVIELCKVDDRLIPTIDFGHLYTRELGTIVDEQDFRDILNKFISKLGYERMKNFHSHFSKMEFTKGGEKRHMTFDDVGYGPDFEKLAVVLKELKLEPNIICESNDAMTKDAMTMKEIYEGVE